MGLLNLNDPVTTRVWQKKLEKEMANYNTAGTIILPPSYEETAEATRAQRLKIAQAKLGKFYKFQSTYQEWWKRVQVDLINAGIEMPPDWPETDE